MKFIGPKAFYCNLKKTIQLNIDLPNFRPDATKKNNYLQLQAP